MSGLILPQLLSGSSQKQNSLGFITHAGAFYLGPDMKTTVHAVHNYKIYIAIHGDFDLYLDSGRAFSSCKAVVIAPDRRHRIVSQSAMLAIFYLLPESVEGRKISTLFFGREAFMPPEPILSAVLPRLRKYLEHGCSLGEANEVCTYLFNTLAPCYAASLVIDQRVKHALGYLNSTIERRVMIAEIASEVALSPSRLEHLFRAQIGISISHYLLWARTRAAVMLMVTNKLLTEVALDAGFSDSAHLSRTFRSIMGTAPSTLLRNTSLYSSIDSVAKIN